MRVAIYSCTPIKDDPHIAETQIQRMEELVLRYGWRTTHIYRDLVTSPGAERDAYKKMLLDAKQHHFDVLIFWALNQLTRQNANNTILLLHKLSCWKIGFCSYTERHLDSCHTSMQTITAILAMLVEQNSIYIGEQTRIGIEKQRQAQTPGPKGRFGPGRPPAVFDQKRAQDLRSKGKSYTTIAAVCGVSKATISRFFKEAREHSV